MEEHSKVEVFIRDLKEYAEERVKFSILTLKEKVIMLISSAVPLLIIFLLGIFTLFFLAIALAWWLGTYLHQQSIGFLLVGILFLLISIIVYVNRVKWIQMPLADKVLKQISDED